MAAATDVVLLSSPDRPSSQTPTARPKYDPEELFGLSPQDYASPTVVSPSQLFQAGSRSRFFGGGSRADAPRDKENTGTDEAATNTEKTSKADSKVAKSTAISEEAKPKRRGRKPKTTDEPKDIQGNSESTALGEKENVPKKQTSKSTTATRKRGDAASKKGRPANKTLTGRVAKPGNATPNDASTKTSECSPSQKDSREKNAAENTDDWQKEGLQLDAAMKRRLDWTPTKDTSQKVLGLDKQCDTDTNQSFGSLLSEYGFSRGSPVPKDNSAPRDGGPTKRKRIELVDSRCHPAAQQNSTDKNDKTTQHEDAQPSKAPEVEKKRKKQPVKPKTLTARVTALYHNDPPENSDSTDKEAADTAKSSSKRPKAAKSKGKGKSEAQDPELIVLSPEAAAKSIADQDLMFGTCSQLEREDSPQTLTEMQMAIHESEKSMAIEASPSLTRSSTLGSTHFKTTRDLWSVAARDSDGSLIQKEFVDMVDRTALPKPSSVDESRHSEVNTPHDRVDPKTKHGTASQEEASEPIQHEITNKRPSTTKEAKISGDKPQDTTPQSLESNLPMPQYSGFTDAELSKQITAYGFKPLKNRKKMIELLCKCWESKHGKCVTSNAECGRESVPPQSGLSSQTEPKKPSRKKAATNKDKTVAKAKDKDSASLKATNEIRPSTAPDFSSHAPHPNKSPKKPVSRPAPPRRSFIDVEEIQDSEEETIPSPSRILTQNGLRACEKNGEQSLPTSPRPSKSTASTSKSTTKLPKSATNSARTPQRPQSTPPSTPSSSGATTPCDLPNQITLAVRTQAKQSQISIRKRLTWHEKILMYDPIVIEDLTTWLNTEGFGLVGEDREINPGAVRTWCESKGICCCYRRKAF